MKSIITMTVYQEIKHFLVTDNLLYIYRNDKSFIEQNLYENQSLSYLGKNMHNNYMADWKDIFIFFIFFSLINSFIFHKRNAANGICKTDKINLFSSECGFVYDQTIN